MWERVQLPEPPRQLVSEEDGMEGGLVRPAEILQDKLAHKPQTWSQWKDQMQLHAPHELWQDLFNSYEQNQVNKAVRNGLTLSQSVKWSGDVLQPVSFPANSTNTNLLVNTVGHLAAKLQQIIPSRVCSQLTELKGDSPGGHEGHFKQMLILFSMFSAAS